MKSVEQQFARVALECVGRVQRSGKSTLIEEYDRLCHQFPQMILTNGLRLTIAFFQSKEKDKENNKENNNENKQESTYKIFLEDMKRALNLPNDWHDVVTHMQASEYRLFTIRALKAAQWFKRYARALLHQEKDGQDQSKSTSTQDETVQSVT